jgi:hypothetical protein
VTSATLSVSLPKIVMTCPQQRIFFVALNNLHYLRDLQPIARSGFAERLHTPQN